MAFNEYIPISNQLIGLFSEAISLLSLKEIANIERQFADALLFYHDLNSNSN